MNLNGSDGSHSLTNPTHSFFFFFFDFDFALFSMLFSRTSATASGVCLIQLVNGIGVRVVYVKCANPLLLLVQMATGQRLFQIVGLYS